MSAGTGPLSGLKVVELARILAGPWAGQTLADLGAEVLKLESPAGDDTRRWGPPFVEKDGDVSAAYFHSCNRGKDSEVVDFRTPEGQARVRDLLANADDDHTTSATEGPLRGETDRFMMRYRRQ